MSTTNLLVVEDEEIVAFDLETSLKSLGYNVIAIVASGEEAIQEAATNQPNLILMDIRLKGKMDGIQAAEQIANQFNIPIVYLTAHADAATLQRAKITTPFGYLVKPFEENALQTTIEIALARHHAEEIMRRALNKEKELNQLKSQFIAIASHEFRTPLTTIRLSTDLLELFCKDFMDDKKGKQFNKIYKAIADMVQLVDEVLVIEKAQAGKLDFEPQKLNLAIFLNSFIEQFKSNIGDRYILNFNCHDCAHSDAFIDETLLRYILNNLLSNAAKYSPQGGTIDVELSDRDEMVILCVRDRGIGIPEENQARLFEPFYRASNVKKFQGTGIGLSIVKQCVDLHNGQISVESQLGVGTTITIMLPLNAEKA